MIVGTEEVLYNWFFFFFFFFFFLIYKKKEEKEKEKRTCNLADYIIPNPTDK